MPPSHLESDAVFGFGFLHAGRIVCLGGFIDTFSILICLRCQVPLRLLLPRYPLLSVGMIFCMSCLLVSVEPLARDRKLLGE